MYREIRGQAYCRREYTGGIPAPRINQFVMGSQNVDFPTVYHVIIKEQCQIRHTALEAARITANKYIQKKIGTTNYKLSILVYPHHILRENKQATGAGADRVSMGMRRAFGKNIGTAARVRAGQKIMRLEVFPSSEIVAKEALRKAAMKLPSPVFIVKIS